jgi:hypothetical protein
MFSQTELLDSLSVANKKIKARWPWPMTEGRRNMAYSTEEQDYPSDMKSDSVYMLLIGGKRYDKKNFQSYQVYREDQPDRDEKIFSDWNRTLFINPNAGASGTIVCYGQVILTDINTSASTTVFSVAEPEIDEAMVQLAYAELLDSEKMKNPQKAQVVRQNAFAVVDGVWDTIKLKQYTYQDKSAQMFKGIDVLNGNVDDDNINNPLRW